MTDIINLRGVKKVFTIGVVAATILWSIGIAAVVPLSADAATKPAGTLISAAQLVSGDRVKGETNPAVYYYGANGKRIVFPNEKTYKSWYQDFLGVKTVSDADLATLSLGGNVTYRPGVKMVKITTDPKVYAVAANGSLRHITTEALAVTLYGPNWNQQIDDVPDAFFTNYTVGMAISAATDFVPATVSAAATTINVDKALLAGTIAPTADGLSVNSDGPAPQALPTTGSLVLLANFKFSGTGTINALTLKRIGISADTTLSNVYLFDGNNRLSDGAAVSSNSVVNFTGLNIAVSGSKTISAKADILTGTGGQTVGLELTGATLAAGSVTGLPVAGNIHTVATATLASVALGTATASGNADPGNDVLLWQSTATASTRDVTLGRLSLRQIGSINAADINTFRLFIDGTEAASTEKLDANGYVTFTLDKKLTTGARILKVLGNVVGGSGRTVQLSLRGAYDISAVDTQYTTGVLATTSGGFPLHASAWTVNAGTMTVVKADDSPANNVTAGASDVPLAKYKFTAYGENIKVETLKVGMITTGGTVTDHTLRNVRILVNGAQVGSTTNVPAAASFAANTGTQFTTNFTVTPGTPATVEIRGDIFDSEGDNNVITATTFTAAQALLVGGTGSSNGTPAVSITAINVPSASNEAGNTLTIATGNVGLAQKSSYSAQTIVAPQSHYKLASFTLTGNATEAVNINTFEVDFAGSSTEATVLTDVSIKYGNQTTSVKGTVAESDNSWSVNFPLAKNESMEINVYGSINSTLSTNTIRADLTVTGVTAESATTVYGDSSNSSPNDIVKDAGATAQVITGGTGSFTVSVDPTTPSSALVDDTGNVTVAAFKFAAVNDAYTLTDVTLTLANASAVSAVTLYDGTTAVTGGSKAGATTVTFNGLSVPVAANTNKVLTVQLTMAPVGVGGGTAGSSLLTTLTTATGRSSGGTSAAVTESPSNPAANVAYVYKSVPTITNVTLPTSILSVGTVTASRITISSGGTGPISWRKLIWTGTRSMGGTDTLATPQLWDADTNTQISGTGIFTGSFNVDSDVAGGVEFIADAEQTISGSKNYDLKLTTAGTFTTGDYLSLSVAQPSAFAAQTAAFASNTASANGYYDLDGSTVSTSDVRTTAAAQYTVPDVTATTTVVGHNGSGKIRDAYGVTGNVTLTLAEFTTDNVINAATFTVTGAGATGLTCTPYTGTAQTGAVTSQSTAFSAIQSVGCTGTGMSLNIDSLTVTNDSGAGTSEVGLVIVITKASDYANGSVVAATDSDVDLATTGGVAAAATFVWSDISAAAHSSTTTDWTNALLVKNLPTSAQTLTK